MRDIEGACCRTSMIPLPSCLTHATYFQRFSMPASIFADAAISYTDIWWAMIITAWCAGFCFIRALDGHYRYGPWDIGQYFNFAYKSLAIFVRPCHLIRYYSLFSHIISLGQGQIDLRWFLPPSFSTSWRTPACSERKKKPFSDIACIFRLFDSSSIRRYALHLLQAAINDMYAFL